MKYRYENLLDPDLYQSKTCSRFIEIMNEPCVNEAALKKVDELQKNFPSADDLLSYLEKAEKDAQSRFLQSGIVFPTFSIYEDKVPIKLKFDVPTHINQIKEMHVAGKCFAFIHCSPFIFFSTLSPHDECNKIIFDKQEILKNETSLGIYVGGSSIKGNSFMSLTKMNRNKSISFQNVRRQILRESNSEFPISQLFSIKDENEMCDILNCIPKLIKLNPDLDEKTCVINFASCLKALAFFKQN